MTKTSLKVILFLSLIFLSCRSDRIQSIYIYYVPLATTSAMTIDCDLFELAYEPVLKKQKISDADQINEFNQYLKYLAYSEETIAFNDVRVKCIVFYNDHTDTICVTLGDEIIYNGQLMHDEGRFVKFIKHQINRE